MVGRGQRQSILRDTRGEPAISDSLRQGPLGRGFLGLGFGNWGIRV